MAERQTRPAQGPGSVPAAGSAGGHGGERGSPRAGWALNPEGQGVASVPGPAGM